MRLHEEDSSNVSWAMHGPLNNPYEDTIPSTNTHRHRGKLFYFRYGLPAASRRRDVINPFSWCNLWQRMNAAANTFCIAISITQTQIDRIFHHVIVVGIQKIQISIASINRIGEKSSIGKWIDLAMPDVAISCSYKIFPNSFWGLWYGFAFFVLSIERSSIRHNCERAHLNEVIEMTQILPY